LAWYLSPGVERCAAEYKGSVHPFTEATAGVDANHELTNGSGGMTAPVDGLAEARPGLNHTAGWLGRLRIPVATRIWGLTLILMAVAATIYLVTLQGRPGPQVQFHIPWPAMAFAVAIAELRVVVVHFRRETHSFSLSEFPAVIGMFFLSPGEYLTAVLVGSAAALIIGSHQRVMKVSFNLANFILMAMVSLAVLYQFAHLDGAPHIGDWLAAFAATEISTILTAVIVATVITVSGGAPQFEKLPEMIRFGSLVAFANTSLALLAVSILWLDPSLLWLLILPVLIVFLAYQAYVSEREKHERLELLYQSSRILQHSPELDSALVALLGHARTMFRAELAEVVLYARHPNEEALRTRSWHEGEPEIMTPVIMLGDDRIHALVRSAMAPFFYVAAPGETPSVRQGMVSPMRGESDLIGYLLIANRLTEGTTFSADDLRLLETLANQAASALEHGHLEQSLAELSRLKEQLKYQAYHDSLTHLPNRSLFLERVTERLADRRSRRNAVVLFLDLDDFKIVNDTLGHAAGDRLLVEVGDRLRSVLRTEDLAARLGGDEFALLLDDETDLERSMNVANRLIDAFRINFQVEGQDITVGASIGLAVARAGTETADELLRNADVAMYTAKSSGKNRVAVFEPTMHAAIVARHALSAELSRSLARGELAVHYQPIIDLQSGIAAGVEALVRWHHPTRGLVGPDEFIPLAEETGVILPIGSWVLEEACAQASRWASYGRHGAGVSVTVNLSAQQLAEAPFVEDLRRILAKTGLPAERLILEMTETVMFHDTSTTIARLEAIRDLGVRIAIDDFGTGYSSLGYLRRFRVDILKIAREFVGSADSEEEWAFAGAIVALGRTLGLTIIAEGIEEEGQLERLRSLGCEYGQGYLFARPNDADTISEFLKIRSGPRLVHASTMQGPTSVDGARTDAREPQPVLLPSRVGTWI
jgi:diguanylate cyclase (GGDEF)-like protein